MSCIKTRLLDQTEQIYALVADCHGFTIEAETYEHITIDCNTPSDAVAMAYLLHEEGFRAHILNRHKVQVTLGYQEASHTLFTGATKHQQLEVLTL